MSHLLRREYAYYSWEHDFPEEVDQALEDDYVRNRSMYADTTLKCVALLLIVAPDAGPAEVLSLVRGHHQRHTPASLSPPLPFDLEDEP